MGIISRIWTQQCPPLILSILLLATTLSAKPNVGYDKDYMHPYIIKQAALRYQAQNEHTKPVAVTTDQPLHGFNEDDSVLTDWYAEGQRELNKALNTGPNYNIAKNVILFVGDGMGFSTIASSRIFKAQQRNLAGDLALLSWEHFPHSGTFRTYNTDAQTSDSAGTATAMMSGIKADRGVIGVNQYANYGECESVAGNKVKSAIHYAQDEGKWTGVVSTARITHATPAAAYAHSPNRNWENDGDVEDAGADTDICPDIAAQLVDSAPGNKIRVVLGGGRENFFPEDVYDPEYPNDESNDGDRDDNRDLPSEWVQGRIEEGYTEDQVKYIINNTEFRNIDTENIQYLLGLFEPSHMQYETDRVRDGENEPSLAEMVETSINILRRQEKGYFLYVESGRIDHAHHANEAHGALTETVALQDAVQVAMDMTSEEDTLLIVTADHSHAFNMAGYNPLEADILDLSEDMSEDGKPYTMLGYHNGPGYENNRVNENGTEILRKDITKENVTSADYIMDAGIWLGSETHAGEDIPVYARGPMSHLFQNVHEQSYVAHVLMYASCIGENKAHCELPWTYPGCPETNTGDTGDTTDSAPTMHHSIIYVCLVTLCARIMSNIIL